MAGIDCDIDNAYDDMMLTKELYHKTDKRQYMHFIYSFPAGELTLEKVKENAVKLFSSEKSLEGYQMLIAVHKDRAHLHAHVIVNSVRPSDGRKLHFLKSDLADLKEHCNELSRQQGLSVPEKSKNITDWNMKKHKAIEKSLNNKYKSYYIEIADAITACQSDATSKDEFISNLSKMGVTVNWSELRKHITFVKDGHKVRDSNFEKTLKMQCSKEYLESIFEQHRKEKELQGQLAAKKEKSGLFGKLAAWKKQRDEKRWLRAESNIDRIEVRSFAVSRDDSAAARNRAAQVASTTSEQERAADTRKRETKEAAQQVQRRHYLTRKNDQEQKQRDKSRGR